MAEEIRLVVEDVITHISVVSEVMESMLTEIEHISLFLRDLVDEVQFRQNVSPYSSDPIHPTVPVPPTASGLCVICKDGHSLQDNLIVYCEGAQCDDPNPITVHQQCYGIPTIPQSKWLCDRCELLPLVHQKREEAVCQLCGCYGGAMKLIEPMRDDTGKNPKRRRYWSPYWAHLLCVWWQPQIAVANMITMAPLVSLVVEKPQMNRLTKMRACFYCQRKGIGQLMKCRKHDCGHYFHAMCASAQKGGTLTIELEYGFVGYHGYCSIHAKYRYRIADLLTELTTSPNVLKILSKNTVEKLKEVMRKVTDPLKPAESMNEVLKQISRVLVRGCQISNSAAAAPIASGNNRLRSSNNTTPVSSVGKYDETYFPILLHFIHQLPQLRETYLSCTLESFDLLPVPLFRRLVQEKQVKYVAMAPPASTKNRTTQYNEITGTQCRVCSRIIENETGLKNWVFQCKNAKEPHAQHWQCMADIGSSINHVNPNSNSLDLLMNQICFTSHPKCGVCYEQVDHVSNLVGNANASGIRFKSNVKSQYHKQGRPLNIVLQNNSHNLNSGCSNLLTTGVATASRKKQLPAMKDIDLKNHLLFWQNLRLCFNADNQLIDDKDKLSLQLENLRQKIHPSTDAYLRRRLMDVIKLVRNAFYQPARLVLQTLVRDYGGLIVAKQNEEHEQREKRKQSVLIQEQEQQALFLRKKKEKEAERLLKLEQERVKRSLLRRKQKLKNKKLGRHNNSSNSIPKGETGKTKIVDTTIESQQSKPRIPHANQRKEEDGLTFSEAVQIKKIIHINKQKEQMNNKRKAVSSLNSANGSEGVATKQQKIYNSIQRQSPQNGRAAEILLKQQKMYNPMQQKQLAVLIQEEYQKYQTLRSNNSPNCTKKPKVLPSSSDRNLSVVSPQVSQADIQHILKNASAIRPHP